MAFISPKTCCPSAVSAFPSWKSITALIITLGGISDNSAAAIMEISAPLMPFCEVSAPEEFVAAGAS
jgi:hypothetical protein